jgi:putative ABC transport system permease protein
MATREDYNFLCIRILEVNIRGTLALIERMFAEEGTRIRITFLDKNYLHVMEYENRLGTLTGLLTLISGLMACCAIYSLSLSVSRDKLRQIAVHKIFGASMVNLVMLFVRDFARQTGFAILIFAPITYILLGEWLRIFVYAADFSIVDFATAVAYCGVIIFATCGAQAIRLNGRNLVEVLKA